MVYNSQCQRQALLFAILRIFQNVTCFGPSISKLKDTALLCANGRDAFLKAFHQSIEIPKCLYQLLYLN